jgi:hypothetical protein
VVDDDDDLRFGDVSSGGTAADGDLFEQVYDIFRVIVLVLIGGYAVLAIVQALFGIPIPFI